MRSITLSLLLLALATPSRAQQAFQSHPPLRTPPPPAARSLATGPARFVDARKGDDRNDGGKDAPWRSIGHAVGQLQPGATLYLRGGTYYENVVVRRSGRADAPIVLRAYPGERVILDGGLPEFFDTPAQAWEPVDKDSGEYRSARAYPNLRDAIGAFGDSLIGLHTYHHAIDLRAKNELIDWQDWKNTKVSDYRPLYCGPGLWYDDRTGRIHVRLAHTHIPDMDNYRGATDPRRLPLIVAPFRSVPLHLDGARHVRVQDIEVRGGGFTTTMLQQCVDVELDNVTIWASTYGMRVLGTHRLKLHRCALHGSVPPWTFRTDTSLRSYPGRPHRDLTRLGTHALLVPEAGREYDVYSLPINDDWEIAYCDFSDGHDGIYLGAVNVRFHHNRIFDMQDDGIYLSPMYSRVGRGKAELHVYQNYIGRSLTALAFGGPEKVNEDSVYLYRNIVDLREPLQTGRPSTQQPELRRAFGHLMGDHGSPPWTAMKIYHNTFVAHALRTADMNIVGAVRPDQPRRAFNNILQHLGKLPAFGPANPELDVQVDGNLYWGTAIDPKQQSSFFAKFRASAALEKSRKLYPPGFDAHSLLADPRFVKFSPEPGATNDYRLQPSSAAVDAGVALPSEWPDPLRAADKGRPDIGALPLGALAFEAGRQAPR